MSALPSPSLPWPIPLAAVACIAESEGFRSVAYRCPAGVWTIGFGETDGVRPGDTCTREEAERWLCEDLTERARAVRDLCKVEPSPNELGALVSLAYNVGLSGLAKSTVMRAHNAGDRQAASRAFGLWNKAKDPDSGALRELPGLTARRAREAALYLQPEVGQPVTPMPQAVAEESKATASPINKSGVAAVGAGVVGLVSEASSGLLAPFTAVRTLLVDTLGVPTNLILPSMLVIVGVAVVYWRGKQRSKGWV